MDASMQEFIEQTIAATQDSVIKELKRQRMLKPDKYTSFQKTEQLLYNYMNFKQAIQDKEKHIQFIQEAGIQKKSKSITRISGNFEFVTDQERAEQKIEEIQASIEKIESYTILIDNALNKLSNDH